MRPPVLETDKEDYIKLPSPVRSSNTAVSGAISGRRNQDLQQKKGVAPEKYIRQLSIKSNGNITEGKSETQLEKDSQKTPKITRSVSEAILIKFSDEESISLKNPSNYISNNKVSGGDPKSNSGPYLMASCLFFTIFLGKLFGIMCTLILVCSLYRPRKNNDGNGSRRLKNVVVNSPEKGSLEYNKRVIINGLLERKSRYRENNALFS
ncbi:hypothetical protein L1987_06186 [Smallanthus sonchifolius]|uniref:Uncharacterized protein n=1 Tax=Smallanthus sonchifolius TaxID=185202 RepID=A0ACB9JXD9_9ASTR|nr:hypothetical protein L1987_06186 [Smallanthus sonchifolius]